MLKNADIIKMNWNTVVHCPKAVFFQLLILFFLSITAINAKKARAISLMLTITNSIIVILSTNKRAVKTNIARILSANGSKNLPNFVVFLSFLAKYPSNKSVKTAIIVITKAILNSEAISRYNIIGDNIILKAVKALLIMGFFVILHIKIFLYGYFKINSMIYWILALILALLSFLIDKSFNSFIFSLRLTFMDIFFKYVFLILKDYILLVFSAIFLYFKDKKKIFGAVFGFLATGFLMVILKYFIDRVRPFEIMNFKIDAFEYSFAGFNSSFPSWHTAAAFSLLPFAFYVNRKLGYVWILISILIGLTRIYTGYHYLSDVLFGGLIGYLVGYFFLKKFDGFLKFLKII